MSPSPSPCVVTQDVLNGGLLAGVIALVVLAFLIGILYAMKQDTRVREIPLRLKEAELRLAEIRAARNIVEGHE